MQEDTERFMVIDGLPYTVAEVRDMARFARENLGRVLATLRDLAAADLVPVHALGAFVLASESAHQALQRAEERVS